MGLFSKKDKNKIFEQDDINNPLGILPISQDDSFWDFSPMKCDNAASNRHSLTPEEILGGFSTPEKEPEKVVVTEQTANEEAKKEQVITAESNISSPTQRLLERMASNTIKAEQPAENPEPLKAEKSGVSPAVEELLNSSKPTTKSSFDGDIFKRFFIDENGNSASVRKPLYSLDSVKTILADAEKKADIKAGITLSEIVDNKEPEEIIDMVPSQSKEFHYYADEDPENAVAIDDISSDTIYTPIEEPVAPRKAPKTPKLAKASFKVDFEQELEAPSAAFEYNCIDDAKHIREHLKKRSGQVGLRLFLTLILEIASLSLLYAFNVEFISKPIINLICTIIFCIINFDVFQGFSGIFNKSKASALPLAFAMCAALLHSVCGVILDSPFPYLCAVLGLILFFALIGKRNKYKRIFKNFRTVANNEPKKAISILDNPIENRAMSGDSIEGDVLIAAGRKTVNVGDFIKHSYSPQPNSRIFSICALISLVAAIAVFLISMYFNKDSMLSVTAFALTLLLSCPLSVTLIDSLPLWLTAKKLGYYHAMLAGHSSAQELSQVNAVAIDSQDLFPKGSVTLSGIQSLSPNKLDETILLAATLAEAVGSPIAPVFRKIANTTTIVEMPHSDSIKYEYKMGISGWVNDCQLLIGNRTLMEAHSVAIPPLETDRAILEKGYFPVYVARDGTACVLIAVCYKPNSEIMYELRRLCNNGVTILINSNDPNITAPMICDYFGLYEECVKVMRTDGTLAYKESTNYQESTSACAAFTHSVCGLLGAVSASLKVKSLTTAMNVIYILFAVLGIVFTSVLTINGNTDYLTTLYALLFQALGILVSYLPPYISRP